MISTREVLFAQFTDRNTKAQGGYVLWPGPGRGGGEVSTALQFSGPFSVDRDSRENVSQMEGRRRMFWGETRAHTPGWTQRLAMEAAITEF